MPGEKLRGYAADHTGVVHLMDKRGKFAAAFNLEKPPGKPRELGLSLKTS